MIAIEIWSTKYALTSGIKHYPSAELISDKMVRVAPSHYLRGNEWHISFDAAVKRAEEMRVKKLALSRKCIQMLELMSKNNDSA